MHHLRTARITDAGSEEDEGLLPLHPLQISFSCVLVGLRDSSISPEGAAKMRNRQRKNPSEPERDWNTSAEIRRIVEALKASKLFFKKEIAHFQLF